MLKKIMLGLAFISTITLAQTASQSTETTHNGSYIWILLAVIALTVYSVRKSMKGTDKTSQRNMKLYVLSAFLALPLFLLLSFAAFGTEDPLSGFLLLMAFLGVAYFLYQRFKTGKEIETRRIERERRVKEHVNQIYDGELPHVRTRKAIMREDEQAHFSESAELVENKTTGYRAGGASVRVRVAKGVSVGSGGGVSRAIKEDIITSKGELVITNKRIVFAGDKKSFETPLAKLTSFETYSDGLAFHIGTKTHTLLLADSDVKIADAILNNLLH